MVLMLTLGLLLLITAALAGRWRDGQLALPRGWHQHNARVSTIMLLRLYLWFLTLATLTGLLVGVLVVGAGGRLAMRLLAATSPEARGGLTEAGEVVGDITLEGTLGFIVFAGIPGGMLASFAYLLLHRALPRGLTGGLALGLMLLVVLGVRLEPLRPENIDFGLVGPGWLAVVVYSLLAVSTGVAAATLANRLSRSLPLPRWSALAVLPFLVLMTLALTGTPWGPGLIVGGAVLFVLSGQLLTRWAGPRQVLVLTTRAAAALVTLVALPGFVRAIGSITN